jgi:hypothetical protein
LDAIATPSRLLCPIERLAEALFRSRTQTCRMHPPMPTENSSGTELERQVATLLGVMGYVVTRETLIGHKKVDLYFEDRRLGALARVAVECKGHNHRLDTKDMGEVYASYLPLRNANLIDEILLVTTNGLTGAGEAMLREIREMRHVTLAGLQAGIMDFGRYLQELVDQFDRDGLSEYYIHLKLSEGEDLESTILSWVDGDSSQPVAILGGYGLGKTTFARRMANVLATAAARNASRRIPVLIRLGDISAEQTLEGLLGKVLTAHSVVRNYSFDAFMGLNEEGRLVVMLDGFDEMKHTLTWEQFRYNFMQLNRLVAGKSRVLLLGRPTAFLNDEEHRAALHGLREVQGRLFTDAGWPDYREIYLGHFNRTQVSEFLKSYLSYRQRTSIKDEERAAIGAVLTSDLEQLSGKQYADISRRPVQLRMLAEILPQWRGELSTLNTAVLYSVFIDLIIERELEKDSRLRFGLRERRSFARAVAWWLWLGRRDYHVEASAIPDDLITPFSRRGDDIGAIRRDLVAACFLERRLGESLSFPHRSFQEFLVAEEIADRLGQDRSEFSLGDANEVMTDEVSDFLAELVSWHNLRDWQHHLTQFRGTLSWRLLRVWLSPSHHHFLIDRFEHTINPWYALLIVIGGAKKQFDLTPAIVNKILSDLRETARVLRDMHFNDEQRTKIVRDALALYFCVVVAASIADFEEEMTAALNIVFSLKGYRAVDVQARNRRGIVITKRTKELAAEPLSISLQRSIAFYPKGKSIVLELVSVAATASCRPLHAR